MEDNKFWFAVWLIVGVAFISIVASVTAYNIYETRAVKQMVSAGVDPISAACSVRNISATFCLAHTESLNK